ncbi:MAG: hypothetical protein K2K41_00455, partial [Ruminiclostridium sp.]|nr:hypothetical protein [Ruminiclostridium sp.]
MMNEILETVKEITAAAVKKADQTCRVTRLKLSKAALDRLLKDQYIELGKTVYDMCKSGEEDSQEIVAMTVQIDGTRRRLNTLDRRIDQISELVKCPGCGTLGFYDAGALGGVFDAEADLVEAVADGVGYGVVLG